MKKKVFSILLTLVLVLSFSLVAAVPAAAATITVDAGGGGNYTTIQDAIDNAAADDTIIVAPGTYVENLVIDDVEGLILQSADGAGDTTIDGGGSEIVVAIAADGVTVSGFTITGSGSTPLVDSGVFLDGVSGCTIEHNIVSGLDGMGIVLELGDDNIVRNNTLVGNRIAGIALFGSIDNVVEHNSATVAISTDIEGNITGYGIWLDYSPTDADPSQGESATFSTGNTIDGNTFSNNEVDGVYFGEHSDENTLTNNIIQGNGKADGADGHGVSFWNSAVNIVTGNTITGNCASGMELYGSPDNTITQNTITGNHVDATKTKSGTGGIRIRNGRRDSTGNVINYNNIFGNTYGVYMHTVLPEGGTVDATNNWWGSDTGPSGQGTGSGDAVSDFVEFDPWLGDVIDFTGMSSSTGLAATYTAEPPPVIGILLDTTSVDFGDVVPGKPAASTPPTVTVTNNGDVDVNLTASITGESHPPVYADGLTINAITVATWTGSAAIGGNSGALPLVLTVPLGTAPGTYTATLVFWAEMAP